MGKMNENKNQEGKNKQKLNRSRKTEAVIVIHYFGFDLFSIYSILSISSQIDELRIWVVSSSASNVTDSTG